MPRDRVKSKIRDRLYNTKNTESDINLGIKCRHCGKKVLLKPRGLCTPCYLDTSIREQYPVLRSNRTDLEVDPEFHNARRNLPPNATDALPGTLEKILIMSDRYSNGYTLYHPKDAKLKLD